MPAAAKAAVPCHGRGACVAETSEAKSVAGEASFSTIRRFIVVLWAKKRRENGPAATICSRMVSATHAPASRRHDSRLLLLGVTRVSTQKPERDKQHPAHRDRRVRHVERAKRPRLPIDLEEI